MRQQQRDAQQEIESFIRRHRGVLHDLGLILFGPERVRRAMRRVVAPVPPQGAPKHLRAMRATFHPGDRVRRSPGRTRRAWLRSQLGTVVRLHRTWPALGIRFDGNKTLSWYYYTFVRKVPRSSTV